ncbi:MAG: T9SS type A sorting domain-containing protein [Bacteroidales bacterium]|nr:T9SS type A sorting domain-containing protein [Bacteroidales bacterium]
MRKILLVLLLLPVLLSAQSPTRSIAVAGSLLTVEEPISRPGQAGYEFQEMIHHGHYDMERVLDFDSLNMAFLGNWPMGLSYSLHYSGMENIFLVGSGGGVIVVDLSDPYNPEQISVVKSRSLVDAIDYDPETKRLYLGAYFSGAEIWDMTEITAPVRLARIPTESYPRGGIFADGNLLYVMSVADGIYIYDISDLNNIPKIGHYPIPSSTLIWNSAKDGDLMFCAANNSCRIVDVSDPYNPQMVGAVAGLTSGVAAAGGKLYQVSYNFGLKIWNVSNPSSPQLLGQLPLTGSPVRVDIKGNHAFISSNTTNPGGGVRIIDVSDPTNPQEISTYTDYAEYIAVGDNVVAYTGGSVCSYLDISNLSDPQMTAIMKLPTWTNNVCVNGNLAFTGSNGFRVFDITDKSNPVQTGYHETAGDLVAVSGDLAVYIPKSMTAANPVNIMDISDPANPFKRGHYTAPVMTYDIVLKDHYAFIACWWDGFRVVDFSNPDAPTLAAHTFGWVNGAEPGVEYCFVQALDIEGDYLYLIDYQPFEDQDTKGLYIFDISNPENPVFVHRFATLNAKGKDLSIQGNFAYIADDLGGMEVIDITDKNNPSIAGYVYTPDAATAIDVDGNYAYVANYILGGVQLVDISFPANPFVAGYYKPSGVFALGVTIHGSNAYIADGIAGFQIYDNLIITDINEAEKIPAPLIRVFPNPASTKAEIVFNVDKTTFCEASILDIHGKTVCTLYKGSVTAGNKKFEWDGQSSSGSYLPNGLYLVNIQLDDVIHNSRLILIR